MSEIADGRYEIAIEELKKAYEVLPHPNVLYNIARAYVDEGDLENAVAYYRKYLEGNPKDRDEVAQIVAALEARIRKQQAEIVESQQPATPPGAGETPATGTQPGTSTSAGAQPSSDAGPAPSAELRAEIRPAGVIPTGPGGTPPGGGLGEGAGLKTEEVFEETVVTASKSAQSPLDAPNSTSIITEQDIRLSGITKLPELLRRLAGVDIMEVTGAQTEVSLRGFNQRLSNKVLVLVDGRSMFIDLLGATLWSTLPIGVEDIDRIEVVRGPGSALYGADAFNGVINIISKQPGTGGSGVAAGYGTVNTVHGSVWASGRDKETAFRLSGGYDNLPRWSREVPDGRQDLTLATGDQDTSQRTVRLDGVVTRQLGKDATAGVQAGYMNGTVELFGIGPINDLVLSPFTVSDVTAFVDTKHVEVRAFYNSAVGDSNLNSQYIGQSLLPSRFSTNVVDVEAQYIDQLETGKDVKHDLHIGAAYRLKVFEWTYMAQNETENHAGFFVHDEVKITPAFAIVGDYRADYVPYLQSIVQSPRGSVLLHPSKRSTLRGIVGTAFRTPTFLESYLSLPIQLPITGTETLSQSQPADDPTFRLKPEHILTTELGYLSSESDYFTLDTAFFYNHVNNLIELAPNRPITVGDLANPQVPAGATQLGPEQGFYPVFLGGWDNQCQTYNVLGAEIGVRTFPVEGLDVYANTTLMDVIQDDDGCSVAQKSLLVTDARTSAVKVNGGVQLRTKIGLDGSIDGHYVSPETWGEQVTDLAKQRIEYQSFHLASYELLNASVAYRFLRNQAEIRAVGFNLLDDQHREHPFGQVLDRRLMGIFSYRF